MSAKRWIKSEISVGCEAIGFQDPSVLFDKLVECFKTIKEAGAYNHIVERTGINDLVRDVTGINFAFELIGDETTTPSLMVLNRILDKNHVFLKKMESLDGDSPSIEVYERYFNKENLSVLIDRKKGRISGDLAMIPVNAVVTVSAIKQWPAEELAVGLLHEIGHVWTTYEHIADAAISNLAIRAAAEEMMNLTSKRERIKVVAATLNKLRVNEVPEEGMVESNDKEVLITHLSLHYLKERRTEEGYRFYSARACEFAADQFATRHGAGKWLVKAAYRTARGEELAIRHTSMMRAISNILLTTTKATLVGGLAASLALVVFPVAVPVAAGILWYLVFFYDDEPTYDRPFDRWTRVMNEMKAELKNKRLDPQRRKVILEDLDWLNQALASQKKMNRSLLKAGIDFMFATRRNDRKHEQFQQQLESLVNNDLYVVAARLAD